MGPSTRSVVVTGTVAVLVLASAAPAFASPVSAASVDEDTALTTQDSGATGGPEKPVRTERSSSKVSALVTKLSIPVPSGDEGEAAKEYLRRSSTDLGLSDPTAALVLTDTERTATGSVARFAQKHRGVEIHGSQYTVRMKGEGDDRKVIGTSGEVYHELTVDTRPKVNVETARRLALQVIPTGQRSGATAEEAGLVVLPSGRGVLARRILVSAPRGTGTPTIREIYVDAHTGAIRMNQSAIRHSSWGPSASPAESHPTQPGGPPESFGGSSSRAPNTSRPGTPGTSSPVAPSPTTSAPRPTAPSGDVVRTTGKNHRGESVPIVLKGSAGNYQFIDDSRKESTPPGSSVQTYDARGIAWPLLVRHMPSEVKPFRTETVPVSGAASQAGAVDAHWGAAQVVDYYRSKFGRNGLDGRGSPVISVVGVVDMKGDPYINAFWDGSKMVYGGSGADYRPLSASLDIVGHEMTHGVTSHTARFIYYGQSGALDEAFADYFGNAIQLTVKKTDTKAPNSGLVGEDSCITSPPHKCATRDLDKLRTTHDDFLGTSEDEGGVHLNASIVGGALWEIRKKLPADVADSIMYTAMTQYLAPLSTFVDARRAVVAAAEQASLPAKDMAAVNAAFDLRGITEGWEKELGMDSRQLYHHFAGEHSPPSSRGDHWVISRAGRNERSELIIGRVDGQARPGRFSPDDGWEHSAPHTDGRSVTWLSTRTNEKGDAEQRVLRKDIKGGPVQVMDSGTSLWFEEPRVDGPHTVWSRSNPDGTRDLYLSAGPGATPVNVTPGPEESFGPSIREGKLSYFVRRGPAEKETQSLNVRDMSTGVTRSRPLGMSSSGEQILGLRTISTGSTVVWTEQVNNGDGNAAVMVADPSLSRVTAAIPRGPNSPILPVIDASPEAITYLPGSAGADRPLTNTYEPKLLQMTMPVFHPQRITPAGPPLRVSCNRGAQGELSAAEGRRVLWLDATLGRISLVARDHPAGACSR